MSEPKASVLRRRLWVVAGALLIAFATSWLLESAASPLRDHFSSHPALPNLWLALNTPAVLLGFALSETVHRPSLVGYLLGMALQWGLLGAVVSLWVVRSPRGQER